MNNSILVIDDEESIRWILKKGLEKKGYSVELASNGKQGIASLISSEYLLAFVDIFLPDLNGIDVLKEIKTQKKRTPVVIMTAQGSMKNAIDAMREGAYDYITKPFDLEEIYLIVKKIIDIERLEQRVTFLEEELKTRFLPFELIGSSREIREVYKLIGKVTATDLTVLITGESGTGKELVARAIHKNSNRIEKPFIAVNCAAIPGDLLESELFGHEKGAFTGAVELRKGKFELADEGTLFLDEIGEMEIGLQAKLLRVFQDKEFFRVGGKNPVKVNIRLIVATNINLEMAVSKKFFREDLYHRLNVFSIQLPPLRDRVGDIPILISYFLKKYGHELGTGEKAISEETLDKLTHFKWEGNVRELENSVKRAMVLSPGRTISDEIFFGQIVDREDSNETTVGVFIQKFLSDEKNDGEIYNSVITGVEKELFKAVLKKYNWNQVKTSKKLGINRNTLARKIKELGVRDDSSQ